MSLLRLCTFAMALLPMAAGQEQAVSAMGGASSPIGKVVTLIKEMKDQCAKDGDADAEAYDKYNCWCVTTTSEKTAAIEAAETKLDELSGFLEEAAAKSAELKTEIAALEDDIAKDNEALSSAAAMREKENKEFLAEEADAKETLGLLSEAISVLGKVQLLQKHAGKTSHQAALVQVREIVHRMSPKFHSVMQKDLYDMLGALEGVEEQHLGAVFLPRRQAAALEQAWHRSLPWDKPSDEQAGKNAKPNAMKGAAAGAKSYNAKSGGILGLLKEMGDETARNLASAQKEELQALIGFQQLQAAKLGEIAAATKQSEQKTTELADLLDNVAKAKRDVDRTSAALEADQNFLGETQKGCKIEDADYAKRVAVRNNEIKALGETLKILTGDEARSLFDKTISFLQVGAVSGSAATAAAQEHAKTSAMKLILATAKKGKNWALASLAVTVRLDSFTKVKAAMDKMHAELQAQQKAEYEKNEECKKEIDATEDKIKEASNTKEDLDQTHSNLVNSLETLSTEIATLQNEVSEMEVSLKQAGEQRKAENGVYQQSVSDQRATIAILNMAAARLSKFYTLVQVHAHSQAPPPPKSSSNAYEKSSNSGGVMQMLATIVSDAESVESELKLTEQDAQQDYSAYVSTTTASIEADRASIEQKEEQAASASGEKAENAESTLANDAALKELNELLTATHGDCDYVIKYFDLRQSSRKDEMNAIQEAKAILSGANFA